MSAGLPLLIISMLALCVVVAWQLRGPGSRPVRRAIAVGFLASIAASWALLISFGVFHPVGGAAMGAGFLLCSVALALPFIWRRLQITGSVNRSAAQQVAAPDE